MLAIIRWIFSMISNVVQKVIYSETTLRERLRILIGAIILVLLLSFLFPRQGFSEHVYDYGFPDTFFTLHSRQFHSEIYGYPTSRWTFSLLTGQLLVNILVVYFTILLLYKICRYLFGLSRNKANRMSGAHKEGEEDEQN